MWLTEASFPTSAESLIPSATDAVVEMDHTVAEAALIQQFKSQADIVRESWQPTSHDDGERKRLHLSTSRLFSASAASVGPPTEILRVATAFMS
jgi:hypothetical protein